MRQVDSTDAYFAAMIAGSGGMAFGLLTASLGGLPAPTAPESAMLGGLIVMCILGAVWWIEETAS